MAGMSKEAQARIKINRLLETAGWRFFDDGQGKAALAPWKTYFLADG